MGFDTYGNEPIRLVVGLGNPGVEYEKTRHNAGFWFLDFLAASCMSRFKREERFHGVLARAEGPAGSLLLLKPETFMNRSGESVGRVLRYFELSVANVLIAHDEMDYPPGVARLKPGGGHGGHNGVRSITQSLGHASFARLRIGVGRPDGLSGYTNVADYVLDRPSISDREKIDLAIESVVGAVWRLKSSFELSRLMNQVNALGGPAMSAMSLSSDR